jgi:hypothetical protein
MKINGPSSPIRNTQSKKADKKKNINVNKSPIDSELKIDTTTTDDMQHLIAKYVEEIASKQFSKYKDSNILATAIQVVASKLKHNANAVKEIKKNSKQRK